MELEADDGAAIEAIHAEPDGAAELGLVLHPDLMGVRPLFDEICRRLATHGIAVMATEPFSRIPATERAGLDAAGRMERVAGLDDATQLERPRGRGRLPRRRATAWSARRSSASAWAACTR